MVNLRGFIIRGVLGAFLLSYFLEMISFLLARAQLSVNEARAQSVFYTRFICPSNIQGSLLRNHRTMKPSTNIPLTYRGRATTGSGK